MVVAVVDAVLGTALGLFVSAFARTEFQAVQFMPAVVIPQILLCGLFVPRDQLPPRARGDLRRAAAVLRRRRDAGGGDLDRRPATSGATSLIVAAFVVAGLALGALTLRRQIPAKSRWPVGTGSLARPLDPSAIRKPSASALTRRSGLALTAADTVARLGAHGAVHARRSASCDASARLQHVRRGRTRPCARQRDGRARPPTGCRPARRSWCSPAPRSGRSA